MEATVKRERLIGVYVIQQRGADDFYIGSSLAMTERWYQHRCSLYAGKHHSPRLQNAWTKHGPEAFEFSVLERLPAGTTKEDLLAREQEYLDAFRPVFNVCLEARSKAGVKDTPEAREKKSRSQRERLAVRTHCPQGHPYDAENTFIDRDGARRCKACARANTQQDRDAWDEERRGKNRAYMLDYYRAHGGGVGSHQARITHCPQGHPYDETNTCLSGGRRSCRTCGRERMRAHRAERK